MLLRWVLQYLSAVAAGFVAMGTIARLMMLAPGDILLCEVLLCSRAAMCLSCITVVSAAMSYCNC